MMTLLLVSSQAHAVRMERLIPRRLQRGFSLCEQKEAQNWHSRLLSARRARPRRRAGEQRDECAPLHSIELHTGHNGLAGIKADSLHCGISIRPMSKDLATKSPADAIDKHPQFYWNTASPHIPVAIRYVIGRRQWIAKLYTTFSPPFAR